MSAEGQKFGPANAANIAALQARIAALEARLAANETILLRHQLCEGRILRAEARLAEAERALREIANPLPCQCMTDPEDVGLECYCLTMPSPQDIARAALPSESAWIEACNGSSDCLSEIHNHGCFSERLPSERTQ